MRKYLIGLLASILTVASAPAEVWQARYGVAETFNFKLYNADGTLDVDEADGGTEVSLSCNEGAETTTTNDFVDEGTFYSIALTATELQCERVAVVIAATTTEVFFIQTIDNTSAMTPTIVQTGDSYARLGAPAGASVSADIAAIEAQTDDIGVAGAGLTAIDLPNQTMDITGSLSGSVGSIASGGITEASFACTAGSFDALGISDCGTAQAATSTTIQLRSAAAFADDELVGATVLITGGTGVGQARTITDYVSSTDTATVDTWTTTPSGTILYEVFGTAPGSGGGALTAADVWSYSTRILTALDEDSTTIDINGSYVGGLTVLDEDLTTIDLNATTFGTVTTATAVTTVNGLATGVITAAAIATDAIGSAEVADGAIDAGALASDTITAAKIAADSIGASELAASAIGASEMATDAIDADAVAADAVTEVQSGLATASALTTVSGKVDAVDDYVDTEVGAIKTKTDQMNFGVTNQLDVNVESMNANSVCGTGDSGTPWTGCP